MSRDTQIGLIVLAALGTATGWAMFIPATPAPADQAFSDFGVDSGQPASEIDALALQAVATSACKCARAALSDAQKKRCRSGYEAATADFEVYAVATACGIGSPAMGCVATDEGEICWTTGFHPNLCTAEEVDLVIQARDESGQSGVDDMIRRIIIGEDIPPAQPSGGCAG